MDIERLKDHCTGETIPERWTIVRLEVQGGHKSYIPTDIKRAGIDPYSKFVVSMIERLNYQFDHLEDPISKYKGPGRLRSKGEINQIREQRGKQKRQIPHILNVFCGREKLPIKFIWFDKKNGEREIIGFEIHLLDGLEAKLSGALQTSD